MIEGDRSFAGKFTPGQELEAWELNRMGEVASRGMTLNSSGADTIQGPFGTVFMERQQVLVGSVLDYPFKVSVGFNNDGVELTVRPGTVNNRMPKTSDVYLDALVTPKIYISEPGIWDILIKATKTSQTFFPDTVDVVALKRDTWAESDSTGYLVIATLTLAGSAPALTVAAFGQTVFASQILVRTKSGSGPTFWNWTSR